MLKVQCTMKLGIMQPYFYPYQGYFDLMRSVDVFVILLDVQYIRRGWVNRNRIRGNHGPVYLTVPVEKAPRETLIEDVRIDYRLDWHSQACRTIQHTYGAKRVVNHPLYEHFAHVGRPSHLWELLFDTLNQTSRFLNIEAELILSNSLKIDCEVDDLTLTEERIVKTCLSLGASEYINPYGGKNLYRIEAFKRHGIKLSFMPEPRYENMLSILDVELGKQ